MNFQIERFAQQKQAEDKQNMKDVQKFSRSFHSNSFIIENKIERMSQTDTDESKKSATINFKHGFGKKRTLSSRLLNIPHDISKIDSPIQTQKKSKFCLEFEPRSAGLKNMKLININTPITSKEMIHYHPSTPSFKKRPTLQFRKSNNQQTENSPHRFTFSHSSSKASLRSSKEYSFNPIQKQNKKQLHFSDFSIGKFLGKGIFGTVNLVRHNQTGWITAMKTINKQTIINDKKLFNQIISEIKIHSFINHPNICHMYGYFCDQKNIYLLLELCPDKSLYSIMKNHRQFPEQQVVQYVKQITNGLDYLHSHDIIHRDIKPQNILLSYNVIKITDFGWSAYCTSGMRNTLCGTPLYLSPQLIKGQQYTSQVDIWALGIFSYQMLCGKTPFRVMQRNQLVKIINDQVKFPSCIQVSQRCKDFILKCLQKQQQYRANISQLRHHPFLESIPSLKQSNQISTFLI